MQIKQYVAKDVQEAIKKVKEEMGEEAIILSTKKIHNGFQGTSFYSKPMVEVVAAVDRPSSSGGGFSDWTLSRQSLESDPRTTQKSFEEEHLIEKIVSAGFLPQFVQELAEAFRTFRKESSVNNMTETFTGLLKWRLKETVEVLTPSFGGSHIWSFVGPTGIGKTTTLVKLAAYFRLKVTERITLITTDTYRIGAVDQLRQYAKILHLPLEVAFHPEELKQILEKHRRQDLLLIDTAGRNPTLPRAMDELKDFMTVHPKIENHLLLSATTQDRDLEGIVNRFRLLPIASYIFTKIDETTQYVPLFNQLVRYRRPLSYLTNGQSVPEDIEQATQTRVANLVFSTLSLN